MKVLLLVADSLRADAPGFGGGPASPTLDRLAAEGTRFKQAHCAASWTVPSLIALLTGQPPERIGVQRWRHAVSPALATLPAAFGAAGFEVRCLVPNPRWALRTLPGVTGVEDSQDLDAVQDALRGPRGADRLVVIHHWWTHLPYLQRRLPKAAWRKVCDACLHALATEPKVASGKLRELYHRAVGHLDAELLPRWLDAAAAGGDDVLVCVTGDHGESWGEAAPAGRRVEHIFDMHGRWMTDGTTHVPLLFHGTGAAGAVPPAQALSGFARGFDVAPTLCTLAGVPWSGPADPARCLGASVAAGSPAPSEQAITVASRNVLVPDTYLQDGRAAFHRFSLRNASMRLEVDFTEGTSQIMQGAPDPSMVASAQALIRARWQAAGDPGVVRPREDFDRRDPLVTQMRMLGYVDG